MGKSLPDCQTSFEDAIHGRISETGVDCSVVVPAVENYQVCVLDKADGCVKGLVEGFKAAMENHRVTYAKHCPVLSDNLKKVSECKPDEVSQKIVECQAPLKNEMESVLEAQDCVHAQAHMTNYRSCVENGIRSVVNATECLKLTDPIFEALKKQEATFVSNCMDVKVKMQTCKPEELNGCVTTYVDLAKQYDLGSLTADGQFALCDAVDELKTCINRKAPDCDLVVSQPARRSLFEAKEQTPDRVCLMDMASASVRRVSAALGLFPLLTFVQYVHP